MIMSSQARVLLVVLLGGAECVMGGRYHATALLLCARTPDKGLTE